MNRGSLYKYSTGCYFNLLILIFSLQFWWFVSQPDAIWTWKRVPKLKFSVLWEKAKVFIITVKSHLDSSIQLLGLMDFFSYFLWCMKFEGSSKWNVLTLRRKVSIRIITGFSEPQIAFLTQWFSKEIHCAQALAVYPHRKQQGCHFLCYLFGLVAGCFIIDEPQTIHDPSWSGLAVVIHRLIQPASLCT